MEKEKNKKQQLKKENQNKTKVIITLSVGVIVLLALIVGISYAFFTTDLKGQEEQGIELARFELRYQEGDAITVTQDYASDTEALQNAPYSEFSVIGHYGDAATINYDIYIEEDPTSTLSNSNIKINLVKVKNNTEENVFATPVLISSLAVRGGEQTKRTLHQGSLSFTKTSPDATDVYRLKAWVITSGINLGEQSLGDINIDAKTYKFKINVASANS